MSPKITYGSSNSTHSVYVYVPLSVVGLLVISTAKMIWQEKLFTPSDLYCLILQKQAEGAQTWHVDSMIEFKKYAHLPFFPPVMKKPMDALIKLLSGK